MQASGQGIPMRIAVLFAAAFAAAPAFAQQPAEMLAGLTGSCWKSAMNATTSDTHCFKAMVGGAAVTDYHTVRDQTGKTVYEGVSVYRFDKAAGVVRYDYYNSPGGLLVGYGKRTGDEIRFTAKPDAKDVDIVWKLKGDRYEVAPASEEKGHPGVFVKIGPAD
jgi:hypothetical protein